MSQTPNVFKNTVSAKNQVSNNLFFLGDSGLRVMIVGNSITLHHPKEDIGWFGEWGMAASSAKNDYVHQLFSLASGHFGEINFAVVQASGWELNFIDAELLENYSAAKDFAPDVFIFRLGENIHPNEMSIDGLYQGIEQLLNYFCTPNTKVIFTTRFMPDSQVDEVIRKYAADHGYPVAGLGDMGLNPAMMAFGKFEHGGVACHPGDDGMREIAHRIWKVFPLSK